MALARRRGIDRKRGGRDGEVDRRSTAAQLAAAARMPARRGRGACACVRLRQQRRRRLRLDREHRRECEKSREGRGGEAGPLDLRSRALQRNVRRLPHARRCRRDREALQPRPQLRIGVSETHVRYTIAEGEPGMPAWREVLSEREFEELVAYIVAVTRKTPWQRLLARPADAARRSSVWSRSDTSKLETYARRLRRWRGR